MKITGVAYWRKKRHISAAELSALTGVCVAMIYKLGKEYRKRQTRLEKEPRLSGSKRYKESN